MVRFGEYHFTVIVYDCVRSTRFPCLMFTTFVFVAKRSDQRRCTRTRRIVTVRIRFVCPRIYRPPWTAIVKTSDKYYYFGFVWNAYDDDDDKKKERYISRLTGVCENNVKFRKWSVWNVIERCKCLFLYTCSVWKHVFCTRRNKIKRENKKKRKLFVF